MLLLTAKRTGYVHGRSVIPLIKRIRKLATPTHERPWRRVQDAAAPVLNYHALWDSLFAENVARATEPAASTRKRKAL